MTFFTYDDIVQYEPLKKQNMKRKINFFKIITIVLILTSFWEAKANFITLSIETQTQDTLCLRMDFDVDSLTATLPFSIVIAGDDSNTLGLEKKIFEPKFPAQTGSYIGCIDISDLPQGLYGVWVERYSGLDTIYSSFNYVEILTTGFFKKEFGNLIIYPNPATNVLTITGINETHTVALYDMTGKQVFVGMRPGNDSEPMRFDLPTGIYAYQIQTESGSRKTGRLAVQH